MEILCKKVTMWNRYRKHFLFSYLPYSRKEDGDGSFFGPKSCAHLEREKNWSLFLPLPLSFPQHLFASLLHLLRENDRKKDLNGREDGYGEKDISLNIQSILSSCTKLLLILVLMFSVLNDNLLYQKVFERCRERN